MFTPDFVNSITSPAMAMDYAKYSRLYRIMAKVNKMDNRPDEKKRNEAHARMYERKIKNYADSIEYQAKIANYL